MFSDNICWHGGGACKNPRVKIFTDKKGREISVCREHAGAYHKSDEFEIISIVVPA